MKFHVVDDHCGMAGGEDFGAVESREAAQAIIDARIASGDKGGCRCGGGYLIQTCEEREKVHVGWDERRESISGLARAGFFDVRHYRAKDGVERELTEAESAQHSTRCYPYDPKRFGEVMEEARQSV